MGSSLLKSVIATEFQATEAYSSLELTKQNIASVDCLRWERKMLLCELAPVISVHVNKENRHDDKNEVCSQHTHPNP
jgi:hypothetical protein